MPTRHGHQSDADPTISGVGPDMTITRVFLFSTPTVSDDCSATMGYTDAMTDLCGDSYSITRTWTATDASNNTATADQMITLTDASESTINLTTAVGRLWPANHHYNTVTRSDVGRIHIGELRYGSCRRATSVITKCTSDEPEDANGDGDGNADTDMLIASNCKSVDLRAKRGGGGGSVYRIWLRLTDACGNATSTSYKAAATTARLSKEQPCTPSTATAMHSESVQAERQARSRQDWLSSRTSRDPFTRSTSITYTLAASGNARISLYADNGSPRGAIVDAAHDAGTRSTTFDGTFLAPGTYYYVLESDGSVKVQT